MMRVEPDLPFDPTSMDAAPLPCPACGYDLRGLHAKVCPECARPFTGRELRLADRRRTDTRAWLDQTLRLIQWLWCAMVAGLVLLRVLDGEGTIGWLLAGAVGLTGWSVATIQRRCATRTTAQRNDGIPRTGMRWSVRLHAAIAILLAVPIAGIAVLLVLGGLLALVFRPALLL
ncbi:MAG: hypothetical protein AAGA55_04410 [Planctomycetota bacterium]